MNEYYGMMMKQMQHNMDAPHDKRLIDRLTPRSPDDLVAVVGEGGGDTTENLKY